MTIGEIIKDYRTEHNMSYEEFAKNADSVNPMFMRSRKTNIQKRKSRLFRLLVLLLEFRRPQTSPLSICVNLSALHILEWDTLKLSFHH